MADFRKWFIVLAMLALFVGTAAAQTPFTCSVVAQVVPTLRAEGIAELVGDIVLTCTGGTPVAVGAAIPQANILVSLTAPITSRLQGTGSNTTGASEALLLIDEPQPGNQNVCTVAQEGTSTCAQVAAAGPAGSTVAANVTAGVAAQNVFQGAITSLNQVIFAGVPILPPGTTTVARIYRITNVRVNAGGAGALGGVSGIGVVQAFLSTSNPTSLPVGNTQLTVGFVQSSLTTSVTNLGSAFTQCNSPGSITAVPLDVTTGPNNVAILRYTETFPSAFKTRIAPTATAGSSYLTTLGGVPNGLTQNVPNQITNTESGFVLPIAAQSTGGATLTAGLADFGTRFKAVFNNLPAGVTLYVSTRNVATGTNGNGFGTSLALDNALVGTNATNSQALLTLGGEGGAFGAINTGSGGGTSTAYGAVQVQAFTPVNGTVTAVWEVVNTNVAVSETFAFAVYLGYTPGGTAAAPTPTLTPASGGATVTLGYAPTATVFTASTTAPIPRFAAPTATPANIIVVVSCQTVLLFPYVTSMAGLDTGLAISNTSLDPSASPTATQQSQGFCRLYFYGHTLTATAPAPPATQSAFTCPSQLCMGPILPGNPTYTSGTPALLTSARLASQAFGPDQTGYVFAVCDFQFAHGFAFISDSHLTNLAMGYLALVVNNGNTILRPSSQRAETLGN